MGRSRSIPQSVWLVLTVCGVMLTVASALDGSGQGYDYEEPLDDNGASSVSSVVTAPSTESILLQHAALGNETISETKAKQSTLVEDGQSTPHPGDSVTGMVDPTSTTSAPEDDKSCRGRQKLPTQPTFLSHDASVIRKCCPRGESLEREHFKYVSCQPDARSTILPQAIMAQFYQDCIEDLEEDIHLDVRVGDPCSTEPGLVSFGERTNDTLYIIQNGSLLVIYGINGYDVYDTYCLDYDRVYGTLVGYVCASQVHVTADLVKGQLFLLAMCLIVAVPVLIITAVLYTIIPNLHDLHGRALALNCVNFAVALLLECFFQYRNRGKRMLLDDMVLENYAEYFILATFFWLLVNCANNCFHAWYYVPAGKKFNMREENQRFAVYALFAQLIPLCIILSYSKTSTGMPAIKHYLFIPIGVTLSLGLICIVATSVRVGRLKESYYVCLDIQNRLKEAGRTDEVADFEPISKRKVDKVIYMSKYTVPLFVVMGTTWTVMAVTYYETYELPIFYDILFGCQGILMFVIFVCMPRPLKTIKEWSVSKRYCMWMWETVPVAEPKIEEQAPIMRRFAPVQMAAGAVPIHTEVNVTDIPAAETKRVKRSKNPFTYL
ncbi:probable G-protein coupled receptor Mth-like 14 isoform X2 [Anopheles funestus]|uniref:probable G-protein coupled receptor Mth-like 14 isoform X2 n=1 Tax=Anopheles funestus TaxID=62324 RepID=UPI0020C73466|nr:probable G-protein coupled receptor Mth-like 14 isoform X2 [Anopheles funestus]